jgi:hypothetical protein
MWLECIVQQAAAILVLKPRDRPTTHAGNITRTFVRCEKPYRPEYVISTTKEDLLSYKRRYSVGLRTRVIASEDGA